MVGTGSLAPGILLFNIANQFMQEKFRETVEIVAIKKVLQDKCYKNLKLHRVRSKV